MRAFRTPLLAGVGAVALAGSLIFPGIAGAAEPIVEPNRFEIAATDNGDCTATFELTDLSDGRSNWRADYRVDGEDANFNISAPRPAYRPVVVSNQAIADAIAGRANPYPVAANEATVDLTESRIVPTANTDEVKTLPGVERNETGTHEVEFGVYQGGVLHTDDIYQKVVTITVTGCPTTEDGSDSPDSIFGSLGGGSLGNLLPGLEG
ncbi:hypothetical protein [Tomitella biformata]|uniref:hypothetical protein n=1 Tax=Tomitella biformata TaxID=630403 RepID=UPI0004631079|nr:hypothetical protein [Tomitella biformata]